MSSELPELFHITTAEDWAAARRTGTYTMSTRNRTLADVGFIHCSFAHQVEQVRQRVYGDYAGDLVVLTIDPTRLAAAEIRVENLDGGDERFPHIYGALPTTAVVQVTTVMSTG